MSRAAELVAHFKSHARKVYAEMAADPKVAATRKVLNCLVRNPGLAGTTRRASAAATCTSTCDGRFAIRPSFDSAAGALSRPGGTSASSPRTAEASRGFQPVAIRREPALDAYTRSPRYTSWLRGRLGGMGTCGSCECCVRGAGVNSGADSGGVGGP